ncbi:hypothetical protein L2755_14445 [Shewanella abyssi]|uniref:hypothetical protein n=1 Tax=Shewanella abyssi TaxID=311789 RepID=UPI00200F513F|nr:hypothetical protein [Shewanella abyssi]MCL1050814.1 hypothetical protein [Shewanella abyssi]
MTNKNDEIQCLRDLDPNVLRVKSILKTMAAEGNNEDAKFLENYFGNIRLNAALNRAETQEVINQQKKQELKLSKNQLKFNNLQSAAKMIKSIAKICTGRLIKRKNSESSNGKMNQNEHKEEAIEIAKLTLKKYPRVSKSALAKELYIYLCPRKNSPEELTIRTEWMPQAYKNHNEKYKVGCYFKLILPTA